ncbi:hypothetical protein [Streptomyces sp. NPDC058872]|uniref:hypothetical protein n=1 Tax=Streptomyces sp. NPDC058872 TaxID=3346661 RepID=UPI0036B9E451
MEHLPVTADRLSGYTERDLDGDLARWFPRLERMSPVVRQVSPFLAKLPPDAARALVSFDTRVRSGQMPNFIDENWPEGDYGFDFRAEGAEDLLAGNPEEAVSADDVWPLGVDGGGNRYLMMTNGRVMAWDHSGGVEGYEWSGFSSMDVFLWAMVRYRAVVTGVLPADEVRADFVAMGEPGISNPVLGLLRRIAEEGC